MQSTGAAVNAAARSRAMVHLATHQALKRSLSTFTVRAGSSWTFYSSWTFTSTTPHASTSRHHLRHQAVELDVAVRREFSSGIAAATAHARTAMITADTLSVGSEPLSSTWRKDPVQLDAPFLDLVKQRLEEKDDTSAYFMHCKENPVRQAGVFMPLCIYKGVPSVLFTIRASTMRNHQGEVSFPGGKRDPTDKTVLDTALREMEEEVFISRDRVEVLGECAPLPNKGCTMKVHPFVGFLKDPIEDLKAIRFNDDEVQKVFTVPLQDLMNPEKRSMVQFRNSKFLYPVWKVEEENITIWGLTAFILDGVLRRIAKEGPAQAIEIPKGTKAERYRPPKPSA